MPRALERSAYRRTWVETGLLLEQGYTKPLAPCDLPLIRRQIACHNTQKGRLPRPIVADESYPVATVNSDRQTAENGLRSERFRYGLNAQNGLTGGTAAHKVVSSP